MRGDCARSSSPGRVRLGLPVPAHERTTMSAYYTDEVHGAHSYLEFESFPLQSGYTLPAARLGYKTLGTLNGH